MKVGSDRSVTKHLALVVRISLEFNVKANFLCLWPVTNGSAITVHKTIPKYFNKNKIPYQRNTIGFAVDGANTIFRQHNFVSQLFVDVISYLFIMKCIYYTFHFCASYVCERFSTGYSRYKTVYRIYKTRKDETIFKTLQVLNHIKYYTQHEPCG